MKTIIIEALKKNILGATAYYAIQLCYQENAMSMVPVASKNYHLSPGVMVSASVAR